MHISLFGDFSENFDEGFKNISHNLATSLEENGILVTRLNIKSMNFWKTLRQTDTNILHILSQPTNASLAFSILLRATKPGTPLVISALRAGNFFSRGQASWQNRLLLRLAHPDLVLVQAEDVKRLFNSCQIRAEILPNGVDLNRFSPVSANEKLKLRKKYEIDALKPVVLHVGHLQPERNIDALKNLPGRGIQVIQVGSLYMGEHPRLMDDLEKSGIRLFKGYLPAVHELYQLADVYVFPLMPGKSISMPLSVLEAMACNLPVLATRFEGLVEAFDEQKGFRYFDPRSDNVFEAVSALVGTPTQTRSMVAPFSWQSVAQRLVKFYEEIL
jgi:glycosyltransferase involved in cell wall biosynthesis